jgi:hypothetical protein
MPACLSLRRAFRISQRRRSAVESGLGWKREGRELDLRATCNDVRVSIGNIHFQPRAVSPVGGASFCVEAVHVLNYAATCAEADSAADSAEVLVRRWRESHASRSATS